MEVAMKDIDLLDNVKKLYDTLVAVSTGKNYNDPAIITDFEEARRKLISNKTANVLLPDFVKKYRDLPSFWGFIKEEFSSYADRRRYLADTFTPLFDFLENIQDAAPIDSIVASVSKISTEYVRNIWDKAVDRRIDDPEGAITAARTLLEATCKHILDKQNVEYDDGAELTKLYKLAATQLNLAPSQHTEQQFKQILGGAESVVNGLGSLRNKISDAHAISSGRTRPSSRHATLCVNMAGTMSEFLISTYEQQYQMNK